MPIKSYHDLVRRDIFDLVPQTAPKILDFGGGIGATACALKDERRTGHITLFDQMAQHALPQVDMAITIDLDDQARLAQELARNGPFDCILALDILEHLQDPWAIAGLLAGALKPGGSMIISLPNIGHFSVIWGLIRGRFDYQAAGIMDQTHLRWFTIETARELAMGTGLILRRQTFNYAGRKYRYIAGASMGLLNRFCASQVKMRLDRPD